MLYVLNESKQINIATDLSVFSSLRKISLSIEPIDVKNGEYFLFDTEGQFYTIAPTEKFDLFVYTEDFVDKKKVEHLVRQYLPKIGLAYDSSLTLEQNVSKIGVE